MRLLFPIALSLLLAGCFPDDWDGRPYRGPTGGDAPIVDSDDTGAPPPPTTTDGLVGTWVSAGADLSALFSDEPFHYVEVRATFGADGTYAATSTDAGGTTYPLSGTWTSDDSTSPAWLQQDQTTPYTAVAEGIYAIDGDTLTFEVVQVVPDYGFVPATPQGGFGSTGGPGIAAGVNVQIYRRAP